MITADGQIITIRPHRGLLKNASDYWEVSIGDNRWSLKDALHHITNHKELPNIQCTPEVLEELTLTCECYISAYSRDNIHRCTTFDFMENFINKYQNL